jgi:uncharacterized protein YfkK (UPF0435 family)
VSLQEPTKENLETMINEIADRLQVVNRSIMNPEDFDFSKYSEIKSLHDMIKQKGQLSVAETQAFIQELAALRKQT